MDNESRNDSLYIPANIKTRYELFKGFGWAELAITSVFLGISLVIALFYCQFTENTIRAVMIVIITTVAAGGMVVKNDYNQSMTDSMGYLLRFFNTQQRFKYMFISKWKIPAESFSNGENIDVKGAESHEDTEVYNQEEKG